MNTLREKFNDWKWWQENGEAVKFLLTIVTLLLACITLGAISFSSPCPKPAPCSAVAIFPGEQGTTMTGVGFTTGDFPILTPILTPIATVTPYPTVTPIPYTIEIGSWWIARGAHGTSPFQVASEAMSEAGRMVSPPWYSFYTEEEFVGHYMPFTPTIQLDN